MVETPPNKEQRNNPPSIHPALEVSRERVEGLIEKAIKKNDRHLVTHLEEVLKALKPFTRDMELQGKEIQQLGTITASLQSIDDSLRAENPYPLQRVKGITLHGLEYTHEYQLTLPRDKANDVYVSFDNVGNSYYERQGNRMVSDNGYKRCTTTQYTGLPRRDPQGRTVYDFCIWRPQYGQARENVVILSPQNHPLKEIFVQKQRIYPGGTEGGTLQRQKSASDAVQILEDINKNVRLRAQAEPWEKEGIILDDNRGTQIFNKVREVEHSKEFQSALFAIAEFRHKKVKTLQNKDAKDHSIHLGKLHSLIDDLNNQLDKNFNPRLRAGQVYKEAVLNLVQDLNQLDFNIGGQAHAITYNEKTNTLVLGDTEKSYAAPATFDQIGKEMTKRKFGIRIGALRRLAPLVEDDPSKYGAFGVLLLSLNGWLDGLPADARGHGGQGAFVENMLSLTKDSPFKTKSGDYFLHFSNGHFSFSKTAPAQLAKNK